MGIRLLLEGPDLALASMQGGKAIMARLAHSESLGKAICEALVIDPTFVTGLELRLRVGEIPTLIIESAVREGTELKNIFLAYKLVPIEEETEVKLAEWDGIYPPITETGKPGVQPARFVVYARHEEDAENEPD